MENTRKPAPGSQSKPANILNSHATMLTSTTGTRVEVGMKRQIIIA
jgi:hypothetical protein